MVSSFLFGFLPPGCSGRSVASGVRLLGAPRSGCFAPPSATLAIILLSVLAHVSLNAADRPLAGTWHISLPESTELSPWKDYELTIAVAGDSVTFHRRLAWGRREFRDAMTIQAGAVTTVPVDMWPENRHLGAYISAAHTKRVRADWLDDGRILRLTTDLVLSTQQGDRAVNILSDYKLSANGTRLTLTELRSTRNRPIVYVFTRKVEEMK